MIVGVILNMLCITKDISMSFFGDILQLTVKALGCIGLQAPELLLIVSIRLEAVTTASMLRVEEEFRTEQCYQCLLSEIAGLVRLKLDICIRELLDQGRSNDIRVEVKTGMIESVGKSLPPWIGGLNSQIIAKSLPSSLRIAHADISKEHSLVIIFHISHSLQLADPSVWLIRPLPLFDQVFKQVHELGNVEREGADVENGTTLGRFICCALGLLQAEHAR